ncbi:MAG TPA: hypothetical protein VFH22_03285 [Rhodocyclaceae bacterium]|nr:hypothetical protein [Rhodocyclaceae bacterium]
MNFEAGDGASMDLDGSGFLAGHFAAAGFFLTTDGDDFEQR